MKGKKFAYLFLVMLGTLAFQVYGAAAPPVASARPAPSAAFTVSPASPAVNQTVRFSAFSMGSPTSWSWNFGDGTTSALRNPTHAYSAAGEFTVTLKTCNAGGSSTVSKALTVKVAPPVAGFTFSPSAPTTSQTVGFTDTSTGNPTFWSWAFGDGTTSAFQNPTHAYSTAGSYTVTLTASNTGGSNTVSHSVIVSSAGTNPPLPPPGGGGGDPNNPPPPPPDGGGAPVMDTDNTISDQAQSATIAFDGLAFVTGSFCAQTFYPPGKVADFFGFQDLGEIVKTRRAIATELRRFLKGESADRDKVLSLSKRYGELDGEMSYLYATAFAEVGKRLSAQQKEKLARLRTSNPSDPKCPFLYSSPINMPKIENTDFLFGSKKGEKP